MNSKVKIISLTHSEKRKLFHTFFFISTFIFILWLIKICELLFETDFAAFGVFPREPQGLLGVLTAPLIHGDVPHLISNTIPLFVLGAGLFYFYRQVAYKTFFWIYVLSGFWVWLSARPAYHIGASGIIYGLAAFHFFSGIIRGNQYLMAFSLLVVFIYGSMVWGIFPLIEHVSWESHLLGGMAGTCCAIYFRKVGLQKIEYHWPEEEENDDINYVEEQEESKKEEEEDKEPPTINYIYKENRPEDKIL